MSTVKISVIIPTCHRNDLLAKCLDCLAPGVQTLPADQYEVIVSDDGSKSTAEGMLRELFPWAKLVAGPKKGPAANRNNGSTIARGEWLVFTDDDCLPEPRWLQAFAIAAAHQTKALEGAIHPVGDLSRDMAECPINLQGGCFWSANIAVEHSLFKEIGGFDADYLVAAHEDQDIKIRLSQKTAIAFVPNAVVYHPVRIATLGSVLQSLPKRCRAWAFHMHKHAPSNDTKETIRFGLSQYMFHLTTLKRHLNLLHIKSSLSTILMLLIGIPFILLHYSHLQSARS